MDRPLLLDLFCGAGGAAVGYYRAGFDVIGVDIKPQPRYPFQFEQAGALDYLREEIALPARKVDAVHASPPCQAHTTMSNRHRGKGGKADSHVDLIAATRDALIELGVPYIIENVPGASRHLRAPILIHGGVFGLNVFRPRLFESNIPLVAPPPTPAPANPVGVYGRQHDGRRLFTRKDGTSQRAAASLEQGGDAMGIDWMQWRELAEAIPPAYTEFLGKQLLAHLQQNRSVA